jgi:hypothetical protein
MSNEYLNEGELTKKRTPSELRNWLIQKVSQICSTDEGTRAFRMQTGLIKQLVEEISPLAIFGMQKYGDNKQIYLHPVIGNQPYDAIIADSRHNPPIKTYIEITLSHEGEDDYWRRCELLNNNFVFLHSPVIKEGKGKNRKITIPPKATSVEERVKNELDRILIAARKKEHIDYPTNTFLIISFEDLYPFREAMNDNKIDIFMTENILTLDLRFSALYLVGNTGNTFREYHLNKQDRYQ